MNLTRFKTSDIDVQVDFKLTGNKLLVPPPTITLRTNGLVVNKVRVVADKKYFSNQGREVVAEMNFKDPTTGEEVPSSQVLELLLAYKEKYLNSNNLEVKSEDIQFFAMQQDGTESECAPFRRTDLIEIPEENWVPSASLSGFLYKNCYEMFSTVKLDAVALWKEAEKRFKQDQVGITSFSFGNGFIQYYAFVSPVVMEGKYGWEVKLSDMQVEYKYLTTIPEEVELREVPTLKTLPPVQAIVMTVRSK